MLWINDSKRNVAATLP